jgi:hypothetical protein
LPATAAARTESEQAGGPAVQLPAIPPDEKAAGSPAVNVPLGSTGNDVLLGGAGNDTLIATPS